jgi:hypothetical protein
MTASFVNTELLYLEECANIQVVILNNVCSDKWHKIKLLYFCVDCHQTLNLFVSKYLKQLGKNFSPDIVQNTTGMS